MKTTIHIDASLLKRAAHLTGIQGKTALVRRGLEALIILESSRRLARLGGTQKRLIRPPPVPPGPLMVAWIDHAGT